MNDLEFAEKAQEHLPAAIMDELSLMKHSATLTATCEGHMLFSFIIDYGANLLASQIGTDEVKAKIWPAIKQMVEDVNVQHVQSLSELRAKYPEQFAEAERLAQKSERDNEHKIALLKEMLGQAEG